MIRNISSWINSFRNDPVQTLIEIVLLIIALLLSLILHELGHGFMALKCGDPTAKNMGRLTLDPRKHLDPVGAICMFLLGVGWAKPVPINPWNFKNRDRDMILVSFAGIFVNLILFLIFTFLYALSFRWNGQAAEYASTFIMYMVSFNISLAIFNLIPVPPLDGFRLVNQIFFKGRLQLDVRTMQIIQFGFLFICLTGLLNNALSTVINFCFRNVFNLFVNILY